MTQPPSSMPSRRSASARSTRCVFSSFVFAAGLPPFLYPPFSSRRPAEAAAGPGRQANPGFSIPAVLRTVALARLGRKDDAGDAAAVGCRNCGPISRSVESWPKIS